MVSIPTENNGGFAIHVNGPSAGKIQIVKMRMNKPGLNGGSLKAIL